MNWLRATLGFGSRALLALQGNDHSRDLKPRLLWAGRARGRERCLDEKCRGILDLCEGEQKGQVALPMEVTKRPLSQGSRQEDSTHARNLEPGTGGGRKAERAWEGSEAAQ